MLIAKGSAKVEEVPAPGITPGNVLVELEHSAISAGTELRGVAESGQPLWRRALRNPDKVKAVIRLASHEGISSARAKVTGKLESGQPTGYSAAGIVVGTGEGVTTVAVGDRVACAGAQCAHHAEVVSVPENLTVPVPVGVSSRDASAVTLGAIALQGVRRSTPTLGETFVVLGLGVIGQLTAQILRANGCRAIGIDADETRVAVALEAGLEMAVDPAVGLDVDAVLRLTDGVGADGVIITAAATTDDIVSAAFQMCRRKGRVVLVGDVGLGLRREDFYEKELDFLISSSYGPGRYDRTYEEDGLDYPIGYVRWTENRNMAEFLRLVATGGVVLDRLVDAEYPIDDAERAYASFESRRPRPLLVTLSYPDATGASQRRAIPNPKASTVRSGAIGIAVIGTGDFARAVHLPNIAADRDNLRLVAVVAKSGHVAESAARQFRAEYSTTDVDAVLADEDIRAVVIATRHDLHAPLALQALQAGKHVLVEKPLSIDRQGVDRIVDFFGQAGEGAPVILTGFNRRFSPYAAALQSWLTRRSGPIVLNYTVNADNLPLDHWVYGAEGGGRNIGEACHFYDFFSYLTSAGVVGTAVSAAHSRNGHQGLGDNFIATVTFDDGSVASLTYTTLGSKSHPKERAEVFCDGAIAELSDFKSLEISGTAREAMTTRLPEKGHREEMTAFTNCIREGGEWPIPLWQQVQAMEIAFDIEDRMGGLFQAERAE